MAVPPPEFVSLVKDALEHLYDPVHLTDHLLARQLLPESLPLGVNTAQALRQALLEAIERLNPGPTVPPGARARRAHQILELRYVEALPFRDVMAELALSQTQYHRDQRHALEAISTLIWETAAARRQRGVKLSQDDATHYAEVEAVAQDTEGLTDLHAVARGVVSMLRQVASERQVALREDLPAGPAMVRGNRTALRQIVISLIGYVLAGAGGGLLRLAGRQTDRSVVLEMRYEGALSAAALEAVEERERLAVASQLLQSLGGVLTTERMQGGLAIGVVFPLRRGCILVIDDNPDVVQLVSRLIADQSYTVLGAGSVREGLDLARSAKPDVILLDIMIPEQDGWDALQALKHDPATQGLPVLVCTVLGESELALALGAAAYIRKPLTRSGLLEALARWAAPSPPREGASPGLPEPSGAVGSPEGSRRSRGRESAR